jgi:hypothetical protein
VSVETKAEDLEKLIQGLMGDGDLRTSLGRIASYFIPKTKHAEEMLQRLRTDAPFVSLIPVTYVTADGLPTAKVGSTDEDPEGRLHMQLSQAVGFYQPFLEYALTKLREEYAPTTEDILGFLCESPLFAESHKEILRHGLAAYAEEDFLKQSMS